jgi:small-conductance mechanosensitive channel
MLFDATYFGNTLQDWLTAAGIAIAVFFAMKIVRRIVVRRLGKFAATTANIVDDLVVETLKKTKFFFLAAVALYFGARAVMLAPQAEKGLQVLIVVCSLAQAAIWGNTIISFLLQRMVRQRAETDAAGATTLSALGVVSKVVLFSILLLIGLENLGVNITGLVAGLGIGGIAVALALQNILGDLFASLSIALDKPFVIGDFVVVDEHAGTIDHVGLKSTRIRSLSGEQLVFSNTDLLKSRIRNFKRMRERRILFRIGVTYQTPHEKLAAIPGMLKTIIETRTDARFDRAHFREYGDSSLVFEIVYFVLDPDYGKYMDIQQAINFEIFRRFEAEGIEFAYPTQTLYIAKPQEANPPAGKPPDPPAGRDRRGGST